MTIAEAETEIKLFTAWQAFPALQQSDIDILVNKSKRASQPLTVGYLTGAVINNNIMPVIRPGKVPPDNYPEWAASTHYAVGAKIVPPDRTGRFYTCTVAGTSGSTEPNFAAEITTGVTFTDGGVTWQVGNAALWVPTWNLPYGIATGWRVKAANVAGAYDLASDEQKLSRGQIIKNCLTMAAEWMKRSNESLELLGSGRARRAGTVPAANVDRLWCDCEDGPLSGPLQGWAIVPGSGGVQWLDDV